MWRQTRGKEAVSSRWAIGCSPIDRTTSPSEDGEVICNEKKSQGYRGTAHIPESRIIVVCPFVKRGAENFGYGILTMKFASVGLRHCRSVWKSRPVFPVKERNHPWCWSKMICTKSLAIAGELTINGSCRMESDFRHLSLRTCREFSNMDML